MNYRDSQIVRVIVDFCEYADYRYKDIHLYGKKKPRLDRQPCDITGCRDSRSLNYSEGKNKANKNSVEPCKRSEFKKDSDNSGKSLSRTSKKAMRDSEDEDNEIKVGYDYDNLGEWNVWEGDDLNVEASYFGWDSK